MGENAKQLVEKFLEKLGVEVENVSIVETQAHPLITITSPNSGMLIGRDGETLRAMNNIIKRIAEKELSEEDQQFLVDVNGYHKKKIEELEKKARLAADRVKLFSSEVFMEPMSSYERMIVHSIFTEDEDITTHSEGEGRLRHVVIRKKGAETAPEEDYEEKPPTRI